MNDPRSTVPTQFAPETRFEVAPSPPAPFRAFNADPLEELKARLLASAIAEVRTGTTGAGLRRAANEAAALAWTSPFPTLVFPALFEEKAAAALVRETRQRRVRARSSRLLASAA